MGHVGPARISSVSHGRSPCPRPEVRLASDCVRLARRNLVVTRCHTTTGISYLLHCVRSAWELETIDVTGERNVSEPSRNTHPSVGWVPSSLRRLVFRLSHRENETKTSRISVEIREIVHHTPEHDGTTSMKRTISKYIIERHTDDATKYASHASLIIVYSLRFTCIVRLYPPHMQRKENIGDFCMSRNFNAPYDPYDPRRDDLCRSVFSSFPPHKHWNRSRTRAISSVLDAQF